ncbi:MAG: aspartate/glutamate racemase family protein [Chloroflexota bacterium]|nr:aspartate/glutamate racemase family protein [Chloroflexota bacterium]
MHIRRADLGPYPLWYSNQGWRARIGILYPGAGFHPIADFHKLAPKGVALGCAGVPRHTDESAETMLHLDEHVVEAAKIVAGHQPDVIAWICTAGSFLKGKGHDQRLIREMEEATHIPCITTSTAVLAALEQLGIKKLSMATPYPVPVNEIETRFLEDNGFEVVRCDGLDLMDNNILAHVSPTVLYRLAKAVDVPEADGLFISCTGLDAMDVIEPLEQDLGKPVITSNQVSFWLAFKTARIGDPIQGYGRLMREPRVEPRAGADRPRALATAGRT